MTKPISIRKLLTIIYLCFALPAITLLLLLSYFTIQRQSEAEMKSHLETLAAYGSNLDKLIQNTSTQLTYHVYTDSDYQIFASSDSNYDKHYYANKIMKNMKVILNQESMIGGFFLYDYSSSYFNPLWKITYSYDNQKIILDFLKEASENTEKRNQWQYLELSDRLVYINAYGKNKNIFAAMIDPALEQIFSDTPPFQSSHLFFATDSGESFYPQNLLESWDGGWSSDTISTGKYQDVPYRLIKYSIRTDLNLCYLIPHQNIWQMLSPSEKLVLLLIILLIFSVPILWTMLYRSLFHPLSILSENLKKLTNNQVLPQLPENQRITELQTFSKTLNHMLKNIQHLKLESYEQKLNLQQAQLQYLHLQIRPHFYINCLKNIYSLAQQKDFEMIQKMTISLSDYFRYIFRDSRKMICFSEELHSVQAYVNLQKLNYNLDISLSMKIDAETSEAQILPLSVLTFVENSIKYTKNTTDLKIHIESHILHTESCDYLNLIISDNCGGFSKEDLEWLNHIEKYKSLYDDYHVGISNIYYRINLTYKQQGMLFFYNQNNGGCVEITLPIPKEDAIL